MERYVLLISKRVLPKSIRLAIQLSLSLLFRLVRFPVCVKIGLGEPFDQGIQTGFVDFSSIIGTKQMYQTQSIDGYVIRPPLAIIKPKTVINRQRRLTRHNDFSKNDLAFRILLRSFLWNERYFGA